MTRRAPAVALAALVALSTLLAAPASAHIRATVEPARAGATNALLDLHAAAESTVAGISKLEVQADPTFAAVPGNVAQGPAGWTVTSTPAGFAAGGPALPAGTDADVRVTVRQLPNASQVVLRVIQSYADGTIERWTELPGPGGADPERPAVVLRLTGATAAPIPSPTAAPSPTETAPPSPSAPATATAGASPATPSASPGAGGEGADFPWIPAVLAAVVLPLGILVFALVRRRTPPKDGGTGPDGAGGATPA